jgi:mxaJ protein
VQLIGDDGKNTPPAHALAARNIVRNVVGYSVYGDYLQPNPPARIIDAVARGDIDVAVAWGPLAGFFAAREGVPLALVPVEPAIDRFAALAELASRQPQGERVEGLPFTFAISVGVARRAAALRDEIDQVLLRRRASIDRLLDDYHVPRADRGE